MKAEIGSEAVAEAEAEREATAAVEATADVKGSTGSLLVVLGAATGFAVAPLPPNSRRDTANAAHINGSAPGRSLPPSPNHDNNPLFAANDFGTSAAAGGEDTITGAESLSEPDPEPAPADTESNEFGVDVPAFSRTDPVPLSPLVPRPLCPRGAVEAEELFELEPADVRPDEVLPEPGFEPAEPPGLSARRGPRASPCPELPEPAEPAPEPDDPPEPDGSARTTGTPTIAAPTPSATANAPTRPTKVAALLTGAIRRARRESLGSGPQSTGRACAASNFTGVGRNDFESDTMHSLASTLRAPAHTG
ncbi:hypothetical protein [Mycolicibacterium helvum]|uniref:Uncharacterized protein n=1 Tax=Mycolicibacterium helvum TaxID=1534349 RepID=A0A7I7T4F5_9MYCO|nr:hypothetical protein [Mycolicibacterium helvum]BBY62976.1 hypothetical protein MHEL_12190 [Mycolicibacterium helvum]